LKYTSDYADNADVDDDDDDVTGVLIVTLGLLYMVKSCADCRCVGGKKFIGRTRRSDKTTKASQPDEENPALSPPAGVA